MPIDSRGILAQITSHASASGLFDSVTGHEPKAAPGRTGVSASVWIIGMESAKQSSGLNSVSVVLTVQLRVYTSMLQEPQDEIDPRVLDATDALWSSLAGGFTLAGGARMIDIMGWESEGLRASAGYLNQDGKLFRVMDIFIPILINDVYAEAG